MKSLGPLTFNLTSGLRGILTSHNRFQIPSIQNQIQDSLPRHYKVSLKPKNLFTTLHLGLRLWTLREVYIITSTGQPSQTQRPKQWTTPVPLRNRRRKQMSEFFMIASETGRVILWPYLFLLFLLTAKKKRTSIQQTEQTEAKQSITDRVCLASGLYLWKIDHKNYSEFVSRQVRDGKSHKWIKSTRQHRLKGTGRSRPTLSDGRIHLMFVFIWRRGW